MSDWHFWPELPRYLDCAVHDCAAVYRLFDFSWFLAYLLIEIGVMASFFGVATKLPKRWEAGLTILAGISTLLGVFTAGFALGVMG